MIILFLNGVPITDKDEARNILLKKVYVQKLVTMPVEHPESEEANFVDRQIIHHLCYVNLFLIKV